LTQSFLSPNKFSRASHFRRPFLLPLILLLFQIILVDVVLYIVLDLNEFATCKEDKNYCMHLSLNNNSYLPSHLISWFVYQLFDTAPHNVSILCSIMKSKKNLTNFFRIDKCAIRTRNRLKQFKSVHAHNYYGYGCRIRDIIVDTNQEILQLLCKVHTY